MVNIFDLLYGNLKYKRHFENSSNILETAYPRVIKTIKHQNKLIVQHQNILAQYIANLMCRSTVFREFIKSLLKSHDTRMKFFSEKCLFKSLNEQIEEQICSLEECNQFNVIIGYLMNHLVHILLQFDYVIFRSIHGIGWMTSDNPVVLDYNDNFSFIIPVESEIYFPLSHEFCLFAYHKNSEINTNPLREFAINKIHKLEDDLYRRIINKIILNQSDYLIFPTEIDIDELAV